MSNTKTTTTVVVDDGKTITTTTSVESKSPSPESTDLIEKIVTAPAQPFIKAFDKLGDMLRS